MIHLHDITKAYGTVEVLRGISLDIRRGRMTAIVGPSGAGKTTLLQIMATLEAPDTGTVRYDDTLVTSLSDKDLSRFRGQNIGLVFQAHRLLPEFNIVENVMMPALIAGTSRKAAETEAKRLLDRMGLAHRLAHRPSELSGGECQRASVARALINRPGCILADEPTGSLDTVNRRDMQRIFADLVAELGTTMVIVTHDENLAAEAHTTVHIADGQIIRVSQKCEV